MEWRKAKVRRKLTSPWGLLKSPDRADYRHCASDEALPTKQFCRFQGAPVARPYNRLCRIGPVPLGARASPPAWSTERRHSRYVSPLGAPDAVGDVGAPSM